MKTVISPEWHKKAEEFPVVEGLYYIEGAEAYASSVEKLLKDRQTELINDKPNAISSEEQAQFDLLIVELALILNQLKTLKPL